MIYRLTYCNKDGVEARVDIQKGLATPVIEVEGTERPFVLSYNNDKGDKSGMFLSSSADIEIYETSEFNIDNLKTSNETELTVTHYIDNVVSWKGFIIPDFFSIEVRNNPVITMTASDRLGTLKNVTLSDLPSMVNIRELTLTCLSKTGLTLPLKTMADFSNDDTDNAFFSYYIDSQRIKDIKGRSISCYDILSSILIASNSKLVQRAGEWVIINKLQHEIGSGKIYSSLSSFTNYLENIYNFEEVSIGARRTIMPVAGSVGIYHEHGGRKSHPANYDYSLGLSGWNSVNGFAATIENRHITFFLGGAPFFDPDRTVKQYLLNYNNSIDNTKNLNTAPYITTDAIQINSPRADRVEVTVDISSIMAEKLSSFDAISFLRYAVILTNGVKTYTLTKAGVFEILNPENISGHSLLLRGGQQHPLMLASTAFSNSDSFKGLFEVGEDDNVNNYSATIRVYGSGDQYVTVNYALIKFSDVSELPKGTMYKTEQGEVFTKAYDIETSIFGDYLLSGLDGYFYRYPNDDTSSIYKDVNTLSTPVWTTPSIPNETSELPLLHHSMRQMRRMFSVAHDLLSAEIEVSDFDPLAIFVACGIRHTVVSAQFDFFKSNLSVELEEVAFQSASVRDFIYSYFGDGESGIKSIGGISGGSGGGGTGGGLTPEQLEILSWWKKDPDNPDTIFTEMNAYSTKELSAYGVGDGGGGGGGIIQDVYGSSNLGSLFSDSTLTDTFNAYTINSIHERVQVLEAAGGGGSTVEWGTLTNGYRQLTVEGVTYALAQNTHKHLWADITDKPSTFTPSAHTHLASHITSGTFAIGRIPTGTTSTTVALGNHTHSWADITDKPSTFGSLVTWGSLSSGYRQLTVDGVTYALAQNTHTHLWADITDKPSTFAPSAHTHSASDISSGTLAIGRIPTGTTSSTVALGNHLHTGVYEPAFTKKTAFNKNFGTASGTVAQGSDSRIINGQTAYGWGNHASAGYALNSALSNYVPTSRTITAGNGLTGGGALSANRTLTLGTPSTLTATTTNALQTESHTHAITTTSVGAANTIVQTDATGGTKLNNLMVGGDWKIEQIGTELLLKYNNLTAARFLSDGSIVGLGEITAYGAATGGEGVSLLRTGGTMTGNLTMSADIIMNSGRAIGKSNLPLKLLGNALTYNASNVLTEANTAAKIKMGNGWTIEQTTSALTIKKNGVIKGTFNA